MTSKKRKWRTETVAKTYYTSNPPTVDSVGGEVKSVRGQWFVRLMDTILQVEKSRWRITETWRHLPDKKTAALLYGVPTHSKPARPK